MSAAAVDIVVPGDLLGPAADFEAGAGTYERDGKIFASRVGIKAQTVTTENGQKPTLSVTRPGGAEIVIPEVGSLVTARIIRITQQAAYAEILVVNGQTLPDPASALVRRENVRDAEIDKIVMLDCFRPGDLVHAIVASFGDARSYYLSTAQPQLGVVHAMSENGEVMVPIAFDTMQAPSTGKKEKRKVAKIEE